MCPASDPHVFTGSHTLMCIPPRVLSLTGCYILVHRLEIENQASNHYHPNSSHALIIRNLQIFIHKYKHKLYSK